MLNLSEQQLLTSMAEHLKFIEHPIVVACGKVCIVPASRACPGYFVILAVLIASDYDHTHDWGYFTYYMSL
jgi:hypothetical protein